MNFQNSLTGLALVAIMLSVLVDKVTVTALALFRHHLGRVWASRQPSGYTEIAPAKPVNGLYSGHIDRFSCPVMNCSALP